MIDIYELLRRNQDGTSEYVRAVLNELNVPYEMDSYGNVFYLDNENSPLLSAHMDTVRKNEDFCIGAFLTENEDDKIFSGGILGGDDKCGVYIILKVLETGRKVNFIFSRDEETGCKGIKALLKPNYSENKELADKVRNCLWCLVLDRRSNGDIICRNNEYGTKEFEEALEKISNDNSFGYKGATGVCSDANTIRDFISTANISVGYYNPHSQKEYISKIDLQKALDYTLAVIDNLKDKFGPLEKTYNYGGYYDGYYGGYYGGGYHNRYNYDGYYGYNSTRYNQQIPSKKEAEYEYPYEDYDDFDYSNWSWDDWKDYDGGSSKKICKCYFCESPASITEPTYDIEMPNGVKRTICEYCLDDLQDEINRIKKIIEATKK